MIRTFTLKSYRGFDEYELADLTRVNLLVGRNNSGKTSILEAAHFLAARGDPAVLTHSANRRGELNAVEPGSGRPGGLDVSHFFFGHRVQSGTGFRLSSDDRHGQIEVMIRAADIEDEIRHFDDDIDQSSLFLPDNDAAQPSLLLQIKGSHLKSSPPIPIADNGVLFNSRHLRFRNPWSGTAPEPPPVQFVTPDSLDFDPMRTMWDNVLIEGRESEVINAMKVLEDDIESIHFLTSELSRARSRRSGVLLGFRGGGRRIPLGSHGDGMRRLLALSLSLIRTEQGILLVDEIDTGLHWTVMEEMWRLVVETARRSSVQVFATTHSYDCIRGLASLVESRPDLAGDVSIQKIERSLKEAVRFDAADVLAAVEQNVELR